MLFLRCLSGLAPLWESVSHRETSHIIFQEPEPQEDPNNSENLVNEEACVTCCENVQCDTETQKDMIHEDIETALRQQKADLKSEHEKAH